MNIEHEQIEDACVIRAKGDFNEEQAVAVRKLAEQRIRERTRDFVVDFDLVEAIDSKALETLLWLQETATEQLGQVRLVSLNETLQNVLKITRLDGQLTTAPEARTAIESMRQ